MQIYRNIRSIHAHLSLVEVHRGVHPCVGVVPNAIDADSRGLVALVCCFEMPLARELVISSLDMPEYRVPVRAPDPDLFCPRPPTPTPTPPNPQPRNSRRSNCT